MAKNSKNKPGVTVSPATTVRAVSQTTAIGAEQVQPSAVDTFVVLFASTALTLFLLFVGSRVGNITMLEELPGWFKDGYAALWSAIAIGTGGIALAVVRVFSGKHPTLNYPKWILGLTALFTLLAIVLPVALSMARAASSTGPGKVPPPVVSVSSEPAPDKPVGRFRRLPPQISVKDPGIAYTQRTFDFNGDGEEDDCRVVGNGPYFYLCGAEERRSNWGEVDGPGLAGWGGQWVDWDGDKWMDWCSVTGAEKGTKYFSCSFTDGQRTVAQIRVPFDAGFPSTSYNIDWRAIGGVMNYCRYVGDPFNATVKCSPSTGRGITLN